LIELLIVVAIILIIAAIAIPNLIRARIAANQSSAAASLRTLASSEAMYQSTYQNGYTPQGLTTLGPLNPPNCQTAGLIDQTLASGSKSGYSFSWAAGTTAVKNSGAGCTSPGYTDGFGYEASPISTNTGTQYFCVDATNVIRAGSGGLSVTGASGCTTGSPIGN
jgi:type II secretory pathway pseudopilin PulG